MYSPCLKKRHSCIFATGLSLLDSMLVANFWQKHSSENLKQLCKLIYELFTSRTKCVCTVPCKTSDASEVRTHTATSAVHLVIDCVEIPGPLQCRLVTVVAHWRIFDHTVNQHFLRLFVVNDHACLSTL